MKLPENCPVCGKKGITRSENKDCFLHNEEISEHRLWFQALVCLNCSYLFYITEEVTE
ncbi:MAG: hypothetical protein GY749_02840 [Desulfobacteraceae bacterium]|nr:hypothetical protein [Desulfobacteraceae bacterium]